MTRDFFDATPEQQNVILIDATTLQKAQPLIPVVKRAVKMQKSVRQHS
jgi:hypothetical protein